MAAESNNHRASCHNHVLYGDDVDLKAVRTFVTVADSGQFQDAADPAEQTRLLKKVNRKTAEDAASDWLYLYPQIVVANSKLSGYPVNGLNSQFYAYDIKKG